MNKMKSITVGVTLLAQAAVVYRCDATCFHRYHWTYPAHGESQNDQDQAFRRMQRDCGRWGDLYVWKYRNGWNSGWEEASPENACDSRTEIGGRPVGG
jgi:hypothetical protein